MTTRFKTPLHRICNAFCVTIACVALLAASSLPGPGGAAAVAAEKSARLSPRAAAPKKYIEVGYDTPTPDFVRANIDAMTQRQFDGLMVKLNAGQNVFNKTAYPDAEFAQDRADLAATDFGRFTDNFLVMWSAYEEGWSWFNDDDWAAAERNVRNFAKTAKAGNFKGILFDAEPYGLNPWLYNADLYPNNTFSEVEAQVRKRGAQFMRAIEAEMPGAKIFNFWLMGIVRAQTEANNGNIEDADYALLRAFLEGWLDAGSDRARFVDGNEGSYYYTTSDEFPNGYRWIKQARSLISASNQPRYDSKVSVGHAVYVDGVLNLWKSPRFFGYYLGSDNERRQLLEHNLYHALKNTDEYVWVYNENMDWWGSRGNGVDVPAGLEDAMRNAREKLYRGQPLGFDIAPFVDRARQDYDARIYVTGRVTQGGQGFWTYLDSGQPVVGGEDASCQVYGALGDYDCVFPRGWSGTVRPVRDGFTFAPTSRAYNNLTQSRENENYAANP